MATAWSQCHSYSPQRAPAAVAWCQIYSGELRGESGVCRRATVAGSHLWDPLFVFKGDLSDKAWGGLRYEAGRDEKVVVVSTWR